MDNFEKENGMKKMAIKKRYLKTRNICKVTFRIPADTGKSASCVNIAGDFNNWNTGSHVMRKLKSGEHTITLELKPGREYQFRYIIDKNVWENEQTADKYVSSSVFGVENSVVCL